MINFYAMIATVHNKVFAMPFVLKIILLVIVSWFVFSMIAGSVDHRITTRREAHIRSFLLPKGLYEAVRKHHPQLTPKEFQLVLQGLRQFFMAHLKSGRMFVSMPSKVVDDTWHEFILYTEAYQTFCIKAFGQMLHHTPAVVLSERKQGNAGIRRTWKFACQEENIFSLAPSRLPLLFALDSKLNIENGFVYEPDCRDFRPQGKVDGAGVGAVYCGADLGGDGGSGGCGGGDGNGGVDGGGDGGGGDGGGGDGGGGCGGGGCGGGGGGD